MKFGRKGEDKLYKEWVKHGDLTPEAVPPKESRAVPPKESRAIPPKENRAIPPKENRVVTPRENSGDVPVSIEKTRRRSPVLYVLLVIGICMLCVGLVLILTQS